jgi:hypothetical protein
MIALREEAARRYPGDPEVWHLLGENRFHLQRGLGRDVPKALAAFERAVTLDPGFSPAYEHLLQVTLFLSREDLALRYAGVIAGLPATAGRSSLLGPAARLLLLPERDRAEALARIADSAGVTALFRAGGEVFALIPDSGETAVHLLRRLASRTVREGESSPWVVDSLMRLRFVATALATRGHLREAYEADRALMDDPGRSRFSWFQDYYLELAMMGVIPAAEASRTFDPVPEPGVPANFSQRSWVGLPWLAARRDTAALARFERRMSEAGAGAVSAAERVSADYLRDAAAAHLALIRGDTALALARFGALPDSACGFRLLRQCFLQQATEATLLVARGDDRGAAALIDAWITDPLSLSPVGVLTRLERARIAERLDDRPTALRHYQYVVAAWRHADPELSPYVTQAREGLARLVGEPQ